MGIQDNLLNPQLNAASSDSGDLMNYEDNYKSAFK